VVIGRARRPLMAFVAVLSFSRQIFLRFFLDVAAGANPHFFGGTIGGLRMSGS